MHTDDHGPKPYVVHVEALTTENTNFRTTAWTGQFLQMTLMSIPVGGEIGLEIHQGTDQFIRIEAGAALVKMGATEETADFTSEAGPDFAIFIPSGMWHNIINTGDTALKVYSIYAPPHHPKGTIHKTSEDALATEAEHSH